MTAGAGATTTFYLQSLGCPKNRVDSEFLWARLASRGLRAVADPAQAELIVINTCAFMQEAVEESIDTILELARYKQAGCCRRLVVVGCLTARYRQQLLPELPEVDLFCGPGEIERLAEWQPDEPVNERLWYREHSALLPATGEPRVNSLAPGAAYLKVAEGCNRRCSFCIIPALRGPLRSRPAEVLRAEAQALVEQGVRELTLVAQDLAAWGQDLPERPGLVRLLEHLLQVRGLRWLRLMYLFPDRLPEGLLELVAGESPLLPYFDLPLQHIDESVLRAMRRGGQGRDYRRLVEQIRERLPGAVLRTSLMVGFPGEDEPAFAALERFVVESRFERLGVFTFSPEEGSAAAELPDRVPSAVAEKRRRRLLERQQELARQYHQSLLGRDLEVLVEQGGRQQSRGRAWNQAPEVDGHTDIAGAAEPGTIIKARVVGAGPYHLVVEAS